MQSSDEPDSDDHFRSTYDWNYWKWGTLAVFGISVFFTLKFAVQQSNGKLSKDDPLPGLSTIIMIISGVVATRGAKKKCPECGKWFAKKFVKKTSNGEEFRNKRVTRTDTNFGVGGIGKYTTWNSGLSQRSEQVMVLRHYYKNHFKCVYCLEEWDEEGFEDTEDFAIPNQ